MPNTDEDEFKAYICLVMHGYLYMITRNKIGSFSSYLVDDGEMKNLGVRTYSFRDTVLAVTKHAEIEACWSTTVTH